MLILADRFMRAVLRTHPEAGTEPGPPGWHVAKPSRICSEDVSIHVGGTERCWVTWPKKRKAWHYDANRAIEEVTRKLTCGAMDVDVRPLFHGLEEYEAQGAL